MMQLPVLGAVSVLTPMSFLVGDSYTVGFGNIGGTTHCNATVCEIHRISGLCYPELDSENAAIAWGPLTAANFSADYQVGAY